MSICSGKVNRLILFCWVGKILLWHFLFWSEAIFPACSFYYYFCHRGTSAVNVSITFHLKTSVLLHCCLRYQHLLPQFWWLIFSADGNKNTTIFIVIRNKNSIVNLLPVHIFNTDQNVTIDSWRLQIYQGTLHFYTREIYCFDTFCTFQAVESEIIFRKNLFAVYI